MSAADILDGIDTKAVDEMYDSRSTKCMTVSLDLWPPRDWLRLSHTPWTPGQYWQLCVGPVRVDWFQS